MRAWARGALAALCVAPLVALPSLVAGTREVICPLEVIHPLGAGAGPTLSLVRPNWGPSAGGWPVVVDGTGLATTTGITIAGATVTALSCTSTECSGIAPAFASAAGSGVGQTVVVTTPGGSVTSSGEATSYFYWPVESLSDGGTCAPLLSHHADYGTSLTPGVSAWADIPDAHPYVASGSNQPTLGSNFNGTSPHHFIACGGSPQQMAMASWGGIGSGNASFFVLGQMPMMPSLPTPVQPFEYIGSNVGSGPGWALTIFGSPNSFWVTDTQYLPAAIGPADTKAHAFAVAAYGTTNPINETSYVDQLKYHGQLYQGNLGASASYLCYVPTLVNYTNGYMTQNLPSGQVNILGDMFYPCVLSDAGMKTGVAILDAVGEINVVSPCGY